MRATPPSQDILFRGLVTLEVRRTEGSTSAESERERGREFTNLPFVFIQQIECDLEALGTGDGQVGIVCRPA